MDTNVIIKLIQNDQFHIIGKFPDFKFVAPDEVVQEVTYPDQRMKMLTALSTGDLQKISMTEPAELVLFADLIKRMQLGEAACLAISQHRGYSLLSDEKKRFEKEALRRIGRNRLLRTEDILARARKHNLIS